ncbi:transposase [Sphaerotilus sp.]|uniref:transposase n=1 Tax=Sphaerotilus sp. TaxID=2093942 RepID=UPI002ACD4DDC|nr:transposase [Sphaerotilus sp.]MDZ7855479.1 transposase [Sphaerotilus sp.]
MDTSQINLPSPGRRRGRYSEAFKAQIVAACEEPGVSTAAVALANGLNANLVRRWVALSRGEEVAGPDLVAPAEEAGAASAVPAFVSLPVVQSAAPAAAEIRLELRSGAQVLTLYWPLSAAGQCLQALKDWGR